MGQITHRHHIIPKYMGGTDDPTNLVEVTIIQHAMFHYCNWRLWNNDGDKIAWRALAGSIGKEDIIKERCSLAGKKGGKNGGKRGGSRTKELKVGIFGLTKEQHRENSIKAGIISGKKSYLNKTGIFSLTEEEVAAKNSKGGKRGSFNTNSQKWKCLETGYTSTPAGLSTYQKKRGIDTSKRIRIE